MKNLVRIALVVGVFSALVWGACQLGNAVNSIADAKEKGNVVGTIGCLTMAEAE
jgi:hypothetical protein